ncbi:serine/threonine kinase [Novymonas esmeraldas]|uniref:Serine/threonine kinase n=1 Tax=Novymonas esmeraldas TaxID=1808958 RepID=A0AAW0F4B6_9TRYP
MMKSYQAPASFEQGRYIPTKVLGTGTYGQVIRCYDTVTCKDVAVKVAQCDTAYRRSALNEINALMCLKDNRDSVGILDSFEDAGHVCIVSELLDRNLFEVLRSRGFGPLSLQEVRQVAVHVLNALASLHNSGYIHCDVKPENIMLRCSPARTSNSSSPGAGPFSSENVSSSDSSAKGGEQTNAANAAAAGQEIMWLEANANAHNQLWRNANCATDALAGDAPHITSQDSDANASFSPRTSNRVRGNHPARYGHRGGGDAAPIGWAGARHNNSLDALFGVAAPATTIFSTRNDSCADQNTAFNECGDDGLVRTPRNPTSNPYCRTCLIDFGAVRRFNDNTYYDVQSLWYRAPEVLCGLPYGTAIDSWSVGCVLFELFTGKPFFPGESTHQQISLIVQHVGHPSLAALQQGELAGTFQLPMAYVSPDARREHVRGWIVSSREAGLRRWNNHQTQKRHEAHTASVQQYLWSHHAAAADVAAAKVEEDPLLTAPPYGDSDVDGASEELELLVDLICDLLHPDESQRLSCTQALRHPFLNRGQRCCNATPCPYTATPAASFPPLSAAPASMPCIMATTPTGQPVLVTASPVNMSVGCPSETPYVTHAVHAAHTATAPFSVAPVDTMMGVEMKVSPLGAPPQQVQAFSTHPNVQNCTAYNTNGASQMMPCAVPLYPQMSHRAAPRAPSAFLPLGMTAQNQVNGLYCSPGVTTQQQYPASGMNVSPTYPQYGAQVQSHVALGFASTAAPNPLAAAPATSVQPLGAQTYVFASPGTVPCMRDYQPDVAPVNMSPYVLYHFQPQHPCATVMSP